MNEARLESRMNAEDYRKLQSLFLDVSGISRSFSRAEFIDLAWRAVGRGSKQEYGVLFDRVLATRGLYSLPRSTEQFKEEVCVDLGALCSYLLLQLSKKQEKTRIISVPTWKPRQIMTCPHRHSVQKVLFLQKSSIYLTVSERGKLVLWHADSMSMLHSCYLQNNSAASRDLWVTDAVLLQNAHKLAVSFTCGEVCFYDIRFQKEFPCKYKLQGLKFAPWCLDYWADPCDPDQGVLTIGDTTGQVSALFFISAQKSLFEGHKMQLDSDSAKCVSWDELIKGRHSCCHTYIHKAHAPAWVQKVFFLGPLNAFVSCSIDPKSSMVISWRNKEGSSTRVAYMTREGILDLDFNSTLSMIATAGVDHQVLLWSPNVTSEPVCALAGHLHAVTAVRFMRTNSQLLSFSTDKVLCLWDVLSQLCVQRVACVFSEAVKEIHTLFFLREDCQHLLLSFNTRILLLERAKEGKKASSQENLQTSVLHLSLYGKELKPKVRQESEKQQHLKTTVALRKGKGKS